VDLVARTGKSVTADETMRITKIAEMRAPSLPSYSFLAAVMQQITSLWFAAVRFTCDVSKIEPPSWRAVKSRMDMVISPLQKRSEEKNAERWREVDRTEDQVIVQQEDRSLRRSFMESLELRLLSLLDIYLSIKVGKLAWSRVKFHCRRIHERDFCSRATWTLMEASLAEYSPVMH
jgi:hypothetical protein